MKIAFITQSTKNLVSARGRLIEDIQKRGHEIIAILPNTKDINEMKKLKINYRVSKMDRTSTGVLSNLRYLSSIIKILKEEKVDSIFCYTIKPIIFGTIAAKINKIKNINLLVTGMGYIYSEESLKVKFIRMFCNIGYKFAFKNATKVMFQNKEDLIENINKKWVLKSKSYVIDGSGVDLERFKKTDIKNYNNFVMISRGIKLKGILEFCHIASIVKSKYPDTKFIHIGEFENTYRGVKKENIKYYIDNGIVEFKGRLDNVENYLQESTVAVLTSRLREGLPRVLIEAMSVGRPIVSTDIRGSRECVIEGKNGFLIPVGAKTEDIMAEKIIWMIENKEKLQEMGNYSYKIAKERFDINIINKKMIEVMGF